MPMARDMLGRPRVTVTLTPELEEMMERWKQKNGMGYSATIRAALEEYLSPKLEKDARKRIEPPAPKRIELEDKPLKSHYIELMQQLKDEDAEDYQKVLATIENDLKENKDGFVEAGFEPSITNVCVLIMRDDDAPEDLKKYSEWIVSKMKWRDRPMYDFKGRPYLKKV